MTVAEVIEYLKTLNQDAEISADFRSWDTELIFNEELNCVFGE